MSDSPFTSIAVIPSEWEPDAIAGSATTGSLTFEDVSRVKRFLVDHKADLESAGVIAIEVSYSGSGDSGQVDAVLILYSPEAMPDPSRYNKYVLPDEIEGILQEMQPLNGYGNNDGGGGNIKFIVETGKAIHSHYEYFTEVSYDPEVVY